MKKPSPKGATASEKPAVAAEASTDTAPIEAAPESRDYGPWKFQPWAGNDRWVNEETKQETFLEKVARKRR